MTINASENSSKTLIAFVCITAAIIGLILGIIMPVPIANTFSLGSLVCLFAFLGSLSAVKDRGNNLPAILAYSLSFLAMASPSSAAAWHYKTDTSKALNPQ